MRRHERENGAGEKARWWKLREKRQRERGEMRGVDDTFSDSQ